ncbi:MAG: sensor domain-containing diguanylate cyclase [Dehalococcoidales bacterium]|nr:MAG: sensor domain-containing diguanylate cyclase [Dehalococcoidales bacterium]
MKHQEELLVISHASTIIVSGLDIQRMLHSLTEELRKVIDISWAAITRIEEGNVYFLALWSNTASTRKVGDRIQLKSTAYEWLAANRAVTVESDLLQESRFTNSRYHLKQGIRSIVYLPLIREGEITGSITLASRQPHAYNQRHISILERLTPLITAQVENARLYGEAVETARIDELTGLYNRRAMNEMIANEIKRCSRYGGVFSLIILDIDTLKNINDTYGHLTGDNYLRQVGSIIRAAVRSTDRAFRYGGDEFAILLAQTTTDDATMVAERVRQEVASATREIDIPITCSLGIASWPAGGPDVNDLINAADTALYQAKREGGNQSNTSVTVSTGDARDSQNIPPQQPGNRLRFSRI